MSEFKRLLGLLTETRTQKDFNFVCGEIDRAYQDQKIKQADHKQFVKLAQVFQDYVIK